MTLSELEALLLSLCEDVYHYSAPSGCTRYVVWAEYGESAAYGDDTNALSCPRVQLDVYTQDEGDDLPVQIRAALASYGQAVSLQDVQWDDEMHTLRSILQLVLT